MPVELTTPIAAISQDDFHAIDKIVLRQAFDIHNQFGRLLDEGIYRIELSARCMAIGLSAQREVTIRVRHGAFTKDYRIDLLLCGSTIVEAKTVKALNDAHRGQGINYLLLTETHHGSLVNFRPSSVEREFLSTTLTLEIRRRFQSCEVDWPHDDDHARLRDRVIAFCSDVGLGLDVLLYREGFATLAGNANRHLVPVLSAGQVIGHHEMHLLRNDVGLAVTALSEMNDYRKHLQRLLQNTSLAGMAWVNVSLGHIRFEALKRQNHGG